MRTYLPSIRRDLDLVPYDEGTAVYRDLPIAEGDDRRAWIGYPPDDLMYEDFVRIVLACATPGGDVANAIIDFTSEAEESLVHLGTGFVDSSSGWAGWVESDLRQVGSISREVVPARILQTFPCRVELRHRELSFISLDHPNRDGNRPGIFWKRVINGLVRLPEQYDHLFGWLAVFFRYARGKAVAYFSHYRPSAMIADLAGSFGIRLLPRPLACLPEELVDANRRFRMLNLTQRQWEALVSLLPEGQRPALDK
jgi:hypothetical protein